MAVKSFVIFAGEVSWHIGVADGASASVVPLTATLGSPASTAPETPEQQATKKVHSDHQSCRLSQGDAQRSIATESPALPGVFDDPMTKWGQHNEEPDGSSGNAKQVAAQEDYFLLLADEARQTLDSLGYRGLSVLLAIPSRWCLAALIDTAGLPRKARRQAMIYRLEEKLPLAAESFTADFIEHDVDLALGVAVDTQHLRPLIDALEERGIAVEAVCPDALLAFQGSNHSEQECYLLLGNEDDEIDVFHLRQGAIDQWHLIHNQTRYSPLLFRSERVSSQANEDPPESTVVTVNLSLDLSSPIARALSAESLNIVNQDDLSRRELATQAAECLLTGEKTPLINLRIDELDQRDRLRRIQTPLTAALVMGIVLLGCLSAVLFARAQSYGRHAAEMHLQVEALFSEVLPDERIPLGIRRRLETRLRELDRFRGAGKDDSASPGYTPPPGIRLLHDVMAGLPAEVRLTLLELRIDGDEFILHGQARSHSEADQIASVLRTPASGIASPSGGLSGGGGLFVSEPRSQMLKDGRGVGFTLTGRVLSGPRISAKSSLNPNVQTLSRNPTANQGGSP